MMEPQNSVKAMRVRFRLSEVLPADSSCSTPLLRLMMATDDVRHVQRLLIMADQSIDDTNPIERTILNGEIFHLFRLISSHLYEAGQAFRQLDHEQTKLVNESVADGEEGQRALEAVRLSYDPASKESVRYAFLYPVRQYVGFHYKPEKLRDALRRHTDTFEGTLTIAEYSGLGRYSVADHVATMVIADALGGDFEEFRRSFHERIGQVIELAGNLAEVVDHLVFHILRQRQTAIIDEQEGTIRIPAPIIRVREAVEKERAEAHPERPTS